jgi:hypothetical protein
MVSEKYRKLEIEILGVKYSLHYIEGQEKDLLMDIVKRKNTGSLSKEICEVLAIETLRHFQRNGVCLVDKL